MIETILVLAAIFVGVVFSVYQVYDIYYLQNFGDDEKQAQREASSEVSVEERLANNCRKLSEVLPEEIVAAAMKDGALSRNPEPLLRRCQTLHYDHGVKVRYFSLWTAKPASKNWRKPFLVIVLINCLIAMFLGGLSLYTVAYQVPGESLAWMNNHLIILVLLVLVVLITHVIAKLDAYLHDLYQIARLN